MVRPRAGAPGSCVPSGALKSRPYLLWDSTLALGDLRLNGLLLLHGLLLELQQLLHMHGLGHDGLSCKTMRPVSRLGPGPHSRWSAQTDCPCRKRRACSCDSQPAPDTQMPLHA